MRSAGARINTMPEAADSLCRQLHVLVLQPCAKRMLIRPKDSSSMSVHWRAAVVAEHTTAQQRARPAPSAPPRAEAEPA